MKMLIVVAALASAVALYAPLEAVKAGSREFAGSGLTSVMTPAMLIRVADQETPTTEETPSADTGTKKSHKEARRPQRPPRPLPALALLRPPALARRPQRPPRLLQALRPPALARRARRHQRPERPRQKYPRNRRPPLLLPRLLGRSKKARLRPRPPLRQRRPFHQASPRGRRRSRAAAVMHRPTSSPPPMGHKPT